LVSKVQPRQAHNWRKAAWLAAHSAHSPRLLVQLMALAHLVAHLLEQFPVNFHYRAALAKVWAAAALALDTLNFEAVKTWFNQLTTCLKSRRWI
jgi:hypothetical protein